MSKPVIPLRAPAPNRERGVTTIAITLILLVILSLMVIFSTNVGFFELRTTTSENRAQVTESLAEYALNLSGEYLKQNRDLILENTATGGWLTTPTSGRGWVRCPSGAVANTHPCAAERIQARREQMYYFDNDRATADIDVVPYSTIVGNRTGAMMGAGGTLDPDAAARFAGNVQVNALLCRISIDNTDPTNPVPQCLANPTTGNDIMVTLIAEANMAGENSGAVVKETWATSSMRVPSAAVPLIASGVVTGLGNAEIVTSPNAGGYGVPGSIWAPSDVDIGDSGGTPCGSGGIGSVSTCHVGEFLQGVPREQLKTTCATTNSCGCPSLSTTGAVDYLSGHDGSFRKENIDILDYDGSCGPLPDIQFFPREAQVPGGPTDDPNDPTDDSLFEYIFGVDYVVAEGGTEVLTNCGSSGTQNCAEYALIEEFNAQQVTDCSGLGATSSGIYYVTGSCSLPAQVGSPTSPVIVVVNNTMTVPSNSVFYGMLFVRSNNNSATASGSGSPKIFGSLVVEGNVGINGTVTLVYDDTAASSNPNRLPAGVRFGKVSGSWLDNRVGI